MDAASVINKEYQDYFARLIVIVPGFTFNQRLTIQQIYFYHNSKYQTGDTDDDGDRKYFYNVNRNPCKIFTKGVDFDTKDITLITAGGGDPLKTWFMERDLKYWMRSINFGSVLNRIFKELPIYGSVVLKIVEGKPYFIDLRNFVVDQQADTLMDSNAISEIHNMTVSQFRKTAQQMGWKKSDVDQTINQFHQMTEMSHIRVFERYGELQIDGTWSYRRVFYADVQIDYMNEENKLIRMPGVELSNEEWNRDDVDKMYWEFHVGKIPGRWLGVGVVEELFEPQIKQNEIANLQSKTAYWNALKLFYTQDATFNRNLSSEAKNGEVLTSDAAIVPLNVQDQNGTFFAEETAKWNNKVDNLTIAFAPVGHSVIAVQIAQENVSSYFTQIQEDIALVVKEMILTVIIPQFQKENSAEHTLRLVGQDLDQYIAMVKNQLVFEEVIKIAIRSMTENIPFPSNDDADVIGTAISASIKQGKEKILTVPKNFYKGIKYDVDIDITGESVDRKGQMATKFAILQAITADPTMTTDQFKKKVLMSYMEDAGLNPNDYFDVQQPQDQPMKPAGGGVSAPSPIGAPAQGVKTL